MRDAFIGFTVTVMAASACGSSPVRGALADAGGAEVAPSCAALPALNTASIAAARSCDPAAGDGQCQVAVRLSLPCGCQTYVNDGTEPNALNAEWQAQGCGATVAGCVAGCVAEAPRVCVPTDGGAAVCEELAP